MGIVGLNGFQSCSFFLVAHKILVFHTKKSYSKSFCSKALNLINKCQDAISLFDHFLYLSNMLLNIATVDGKVLCSLLSSHESILSVVLWENHMWSLSLRFVLKISHCYQFNYEPIVTTPLCIFQYMATHMLVKIFYLQNISCIEKCVRFFVSKNISLSKYLMYWKIREVFC